MVWSNAWASGVVSSKREPLPAEIFEHDVFVGSWSGRQTHDAKQFSTHNHVVVELKTCGLEQTQADIT